MAGLKWDLEKVLEAHGVTRYELAQNMSGNFKTRLTSLYRTKNQQRVDLPVMAEIVSALRRITGEDVTPNDLLEFTPDPEVQPEMDAETRAWMDAELAPPLEPYEWGDVDPETLGQGSAKYVQGQGWVVIDEQAE